MKKGDRWEAKDDSGRAFTVTAVKKGSIEVEVERLVKNRDGQRSIEKRTRVVYWGHVPMFTAGYRQVTK